MALFFFDIADGMRDEDQVGSELADLHTARHQAVRFAGELMRDRSEIIWEGHDLRVEVLDRDRTPLFAVVVSAVMMFPGP